MKTPQEKKQSFEKELKKLKKNKHLKEDKQSFMNVLQKAIKQKPS